MAGAAVKIDWGLLESGHCNHPEISAIVGGSWRTCEFPALVALLDHPSRGWILFDTGYGQAFADATRRFPEAIYPWVMRVKWSPRQAIAAQIQARGLSAADIGVVLVSHFHGDHVGALLDFPAASVWCSEEAWDDLHGRSRVGALAKGLLPALAPPALHDRLSFFERAPGVRLPSALAPFGAGHDVLGDGSIYAIPLPGHAAGHFGVCFEGTRGWVFLVGDAAWSLRAIEENAPPPRWTSRLLGDTESYRRTLAQLHALACRRSGVTLVPSHCRSFRP